MPDDISRVVTGEELQGIIDAGTLGNKKLSPTMVKGVTTLDLIAATPISLESMATYCLFKDIPFEIIHPVSVQDQGRIRIRVVRDLEAEEAAAKYMQNKYGWCWDHTWNEEFIAFIVGWEKAMERSKTKQT